MRKFLVLIFSIFLLTGCSLKNNNLTFDDINDLKGIKLGVTSGTYFAQYVEENYQDVEIKYFNTTPECLLALKSNKIDAFITDEPTGFIYKKEDPEVDCFTIEETYIDSGFIFGDNKEILNDFNNFLKESQENGFLQEMENKWISNPNALNERVDRKEYVANKGPIDVIVGFDNPPFCFIADGKEEGFGVEVVNEFAYKYGYQLNMDSSSFEAVLSGVASGKYDIGVDEINITEERKKSVNFSDPIHKSKAAIVYLVDEKKLEYEHVKDLNGKKLGCMSGSIFDITIKEQFPDSEVLYFNSRAELVLALKQGKIEGYLADKPVAMIFCHDNDGLSYIDEKIEDTFYGICFSKETKQLRLEFNEFLKEVSKDGTLKKLQDKWFVENSLEKDIEEIVLDGKNGVIKVCTTPDAAPFVFFKNNKYQGYEIDLFNEFAKRYGYGVSIEGISFDALISSVSSNKYDVALNGIYISEERAKSVDFSDPDYFSYAVAVVRDNTKENIGFFDSIKIKLYRTFIEEERYKLIIDGIITTLLITGFSILFGTIFGFLYFLVARKFNRIIKRIIDIIAYIVAGLPVVVILMILFYIIFGKSDISGNIIAIIGFSLIVSLSVYGMLNTGVNAIDAGQYEAALALGYTDNQALFKFILPQAFRIIMPSYRGEIISLIKSSSIVGYVTVQDLTRVSDIIRSRTYDAFFPLIVTAIIYFVLAWILTKIADYLQKKYLTNEKTKDEILKSIGQKK